MVASPSLPSASGIVDKGGGPGGEKGVAWTGKTAVSRIHVRAFAAVKVCLRDEGRQVIALLCAAVRERADVGLVIRQCSRCEVIDSLDSVARGAAVGVFVNVKLL